MAKSTGKRLFIGGMSGTSGDGVDVALVEVSGRGMEMGERVAGHVSRPFSGEMRRRIMNLRQAGDASLRELCSFTRELTLEYAAAIKQLLKQTNVSAADVVAAGCHGQTLFHAPPLTLQVFDPSLLAAETGLAVVSDFRRADCAVGGQGAPLVPLVDYLVFRSASETRVLLNLGGIANITVMPAGCGPGEVVAFDTGPANCLSDFLCRQLDREGPGYDAGGALALTGRVDEGVMERFLAGKYFGRRPPKSTDGPEMVEAFVKAGGAALPLADALATAAAVVAASVGGAMVGAMVGVGATLSVGKVRAIASGGGTRNGAIMMLLRQLLAEADIELETTEAYGVADDEKEAAAFAILAACTIDGVAGNMPSCTGASRPVVLGSITPRQ
jgi:anhydro-N-acetylmuramic acid kinase